MGAKKKDIKKVAVNFAMEENLKHEWEDICEELGMTMSGAIHLLAKQMVRERKLPFTPNALKRDSIMNDNYETSFESINDKDLEMLMKYLKKAGMVRRD